MNKNKAEIIKKIKSFAPLIYDVTLTEDMGYEFSAISLAGAIFSEVVMLLHTETRGHMPNWWNSDEYNKKEYNKKTEDFLENLHVIPYDDLSVEELEDLLEKLGLHIVRGIYIYMHLPTGSAGKIFQSFSAQGPPPSPTC